MELRDELNLTRRLLKEALDVMECNDPNQQVVGKMRAYFGVDAPTPETGIDEPPPPQPKRSATGVGTKPQGTFVATHDLPENYPYCLAS